MNKNDIIKWVLIAGAAYLVYRYLTAQTSATPAVAAGTAPKEITAGAGAGTGSGAGTGAGASNTASTPTIIYSRPSYRIANTDTSSGSITTGRT